MPDDGTTSSEELERTSAKLAELEKREEARKAAEEEQNKRAADKIATDLAAANKRLEEAEARLQLYADRDLATANAVYETLPDDAKKRADLVRDALGPEKWLEYLRAEAAPAPQTEPDAAPRMPTVGDGSPPEKKGKGYQPKHADWIEENFGRTPQYLQRLNVTEERNGTRFILTTKEFMRSQTSKGVRPKK